MLRRTFGFVALAAVAVAAQVFPAAAADKIIIASPTGVNILPSLIAADKGYFEGLDVEVKPVSRGSVAIEAISSNSVQFAEAANATFLSAVAKGLPLVAVAVPTRGFLGKMVASKANENLTKIEQFKGKRIGIQVGTGVHTVFLMLLRQQNLKESDFNITNLRVNDMPAAMASAGTFDAVVGWEPMMSRIAEQGLGKEVISAQKLGDMAGITYPFTVSVTESYLKDNADTVQKVVNGYVKAHKYISANKDAALKFYVDYLNKAGAKTDEATAKIMLFDIDRFGGASFSKGDLADLPATAEFLVELKRIKSVPDFGKVLDPKFAAKAESM